MEGIPRGTLISKQAVISDLTSRTTYLGRTSPHACELCRLAPSRGSLHKAISPRLYVNLRARSHLTSPSCKSTSAKSFCFAKFRSPCEVRFDWRSLVRLAKSGSPHEVLFASRSQVRLAESNTPRGVHFVSRSPIRLANSTI